MQPSPVGAIDSSPGRKSWDNQSKAIKPRRGDWRFCYTPILKML